MKTRNLLLGTSLVLGMSASVADAALLSGWFGPESAVYQPVYATTAYRPIGVASGCNTCAPRAVTYAARPVAVASGCNTCAPTTVYYPRRTAYRRVAAYAPVTTLRPVAGCNSCGTQTITMRPVTTYVRRPTYVYRRTYRPIFGGSACSTCTPAYAARPIVTSGCSTGGCSTGGCSTGGCSTGSCGVPTITSYAPTTMSSGCCGATTSVPTATIVSPATNYSQATPTYSAPTPAQAPSTGTPQPNLDSTYQTEPEKKTFKKEPTEAEKKEDDGALQPIPQSTGKSSGSGTSIFRKPKILNPKDRTARVFVPHYQVQQAVHVQPVAKPQRELSADGWRAAPSK